MYDIIMYDVPKQENEIKKYTNEIIDMIKECFNVSYSIDQLNFFFDMCKYAFFAFDKDKIIGIAFILGEWAKVFNSKKPTYAYVDKYSEEEKNAEHLHMYPTISTLCRKNDDKYKGTGTSILKYIFEYYKSKGVKDIYIIPGSIKEKGAMSDMMCGLSEYKNTKENESPYYLANQRLIHYYESLGFKIIDGYYAEDVCNNEEGHMYLNMMKKKLNKRIIE
jgi:hypothetical protein